MITLVYDPLAGCVVPDAMLESKVFDIDRNESCIFVIGSESFLNAFRLAIVEGKIDHKRYQYKTDYGVFTFDENGILSDANQSPRFHMATISKLARAGYKSRSKLSSVIQEHQ